MRRKTMAFMLGTALVVPGVSLGADTDLADRYFSKKNLKLTPQEKAAIAIAKRWSAATATGMKPVVGSNGSVRFLFGAQQPSIVCAVLQVCDVALQAGEQVNSIHLGDTARWTVEPAITGSGPTETLHLIIKPLDVGLETSLIVTTDRRTYHMRLRSHRTQYMPQVEFTYPEEAMAKWDTVRRQEAYRRAASVMPHTGEYLGNLDFSYDVEGDAPWKPLRVYSDGKKTIIQMPEAMSQTEAPSLLVLRGNGTWDSDEDMTLVNYRVQGDRYIVDKVFEKAMLVSGVGNAQDRITVSRRQR